MYVNLCHVAEKASPTNIGQLINPRELGSDINSTLCCSNTDYCIFNAVTFEPQCCELGSYCGSVCREDTYYSASTTTGTADGTVTTETVIACVSRPCTSTNYLCPESMGGHCCPFGQDCASSGRCLQSETASAMSVCTSDLFSCGMASQEARCCPTGAVCTSASQSGYYCLSTVSTQTARPTSISATASATADQSNRKDDFALKVGLGVGIPGGIIAIAVISFAWRVRRAKKQRSQGPATDQKQKYIKPELAAHSITVPVELDAGAPELPAQILESELPEEGVVAELPGVAPSRMAAQLPEPGRS